MGAAGPFDGDLETIEPGFNRAAPKFKSPPQTAAEKSRRDAPPVRKKALLSKQAKLETELKQAQAVLAETQQHLADPATYANPADPTIGQLNQTRETLEQKIAALEESWLELEMALEDAS